MEFLQNLAINFAAIAIFLYLFVTLMGALAMLVELFIWIEWDCYPKLLEPFTKVWQWKGCVIRGWIVIIFAFAFFFTLTLEIPSGIPTVNLITIWSHW